MSCSGAIRFSSLLFSLSVERFIREDRLPHTLFYGPPGTGKTSTIKAVATQLYGSAYKSMVLEVRLSSLHLFSHPAHNAAQRVG